MKYLINFFSLTVLICVGLSFLQCSNNSATYKIVSTDNPTFHPNTEFISFEDLSDPRFKHLINKYRLDTVVNGYDDEFERMLQLRHWIKSVIRIEDHSPHYSGNGYAEGILDAALEGEGFHCSHFMRVQNAVMNAYGYVTRVIGAGPGAKGGPDGNHGIDEIWSNKFSKWFLSDAKYDHHFEKNGIPLSALEVREEYLKNKGADMVLTKGPQRTPITFDQEIGRTKERFAQTYTWIKWYIYGNRHTVYPNKYNGSKLVYEDSFFKNNIYYRDGTPVPQEAIDSWKKVTDRKAIEWTPNVIDADAEIISNTLKITLHSETPNFKEYQMKEGATGTWQQVADELSIPLSEDRHEFFFRAVNLANVTGPEHHLCAVKTGS